MNTYLATIYTDESAEFAGIQATPPQIDLTDWPLTPSLVTSLTSNPSFFVTPTISETGYFEIEFMLANNFWGVNMNFGNSLAGIHIRQGISHLVDKISFTNNQASIAGQSTPIDNPLPLNNGGLTQANPCNWDLNFTQTGSNCHVGAPGGTAFHLLAATGVNFPWQPALGSPDFCAAATHFISAGLATGKDATTCVLTGINSAVTAHTVNFFVRNDNPPRLQLGDSVSQEICALFGQGFLTGCAPFLTVTHGPITAFPGFTTSNNSVNVSWHIYTAAFGQVFPFDSSLFFLYNSRFVSGIPSIQQSTGGFCSNASVGSFSAGNYMYMCNTLYDSVSSAMETSPCTSAIGDPTSGQTSPTYGACTGTGAESVVNDLNGNGVYDAGEPVYYGLTPAVGSTLKTSPTLVVTCINANPFTDPNTGVVSCKKADGTLRPWDQTKGDDLHVKVATGSVLGLGDILLSGSAHPLGTPVASATNLGSAGSVKYVDANNDNVVGTGRLSAVSAGVQAEDLFGQGAYTTPVFAQSDRFAYLSNWSRVINSQGSGIPNFFTWLSDWTATPAQSGTIRQGFKQTTRSLSPYIIGTVWDFYIAGNIYDSLGATNPASNGQQLFWTIVSSQTLNNGQLTYTPPAGTTGTFRLTLRSDLFFQDGSKVSSWDVAISYLSLLATGAFQSGGISPTTGVTILSPTQFDLNVNAIGPFTQLFEFGPTIFPGKFWSGIGASSWAGAVSSCSSAGSACFPGQYTLQTPVFSTTTPPVCISGCIPMSSIPAVACALTCTFAANNLNVNPPQTLASYDPLASGTLIGSSAWQCRSSTGVVGTGCSDSGKQNPLVSYTLQRFGIGTTPGAGISDHYFRSSGNLALWVWSQDNGDFTHDFINFTVVAACFGIATGGCAHFAHGIGGTGGAGIGSVQIGIVNRFVGVNWVAGNANFVWTTSPPTGIVALPPVLYEGSVTLNPCSIDPVNGYDC